MEKKIITTDLLGLSHLVSSNLNRNIQFKKLADKDTEGDDPGKVHIASLSDPTQSGREILIVGAVGETPEIISCRDRGQELKDFVPENLQKYLCPPASASPAFLGKLEVLLDDSMVGLDTLEKEQQAFSTILEDVFKRLTSEAEDKGVRGFKTGTEGAREPGILIVFVESLEFGIDIYAEVEKDSQKYAAQLEAFEQKARQHIQEKVIHREEWRGYVSYIKAWLTEYEHEYWDMDEKNKLLTFPQWLELHRLQEQQKETV